MRLPKIIVIGVLALSALATSGCGATLTENGNNEKITSGVVEFPNGQAYTCVLFQKSYASDVKCDWKNKVTNYSEASQSVLGSVERVGNRNVECAVVKRTKNGQGGGIDCNL